MSITGLIRGMKTIVQCDFDGTITEEDQSFLLLDSFAKGDWRQLLKDYRGGKISVNYFNTKAFAMVREDRQTLVDFVTSRVKIRDGFGELLACCRRNGFRFIIVSNGLDFYIHAILRELEVENIEVFAAQTRFTSDGIETKYVGPDGAQLDSDFKEAYVNSFRGMGHRIIYVGDGLSDIRPAKQAHHIFARGELLAYCNKANLDCMPFVNINDVVEGIELLGAE
jgi:2-hydroxy-3-keto-5-methylthiopentenyl-1-phosphate phosphatase